MALWLRLVLLASLALNLAVVGVVAGGLLRHDRPDGPPPSGGRDFVAPYTRAFDDDQREDLGRRLRAAFERDRPAPPDLLAEYRAGLDQLRTEPFDAAAFAAALEAQGRVAEERQKTGQALLADYLASLTPEARAAYADRLERRLSDLASRIRNHEKDRGRGGPDEKPRP